MAEANINLHTVIEDLAEQVKRLTVDNAVLRAALKAMQNPQEVNANEQPNS